MEKEEFTGLMIDLFSCGQLYIPSDDNIDEWIKNKWNEYNTPTPDLLKEAREEADILSAQGKYADLNNEQVFIKGAQFIINKLNERKTK